jgi:hypothetical protein
MTRVMVIGVVGASPVIMRILQHMNEVRDMPSESDMLQKFTDSLKSVMMPGEPRQRLALNLCRKENGLTAVTSSVVAQSVATSTLRHDSSLYSLRVAEGMPHGT